MGRSGAHRIIAAVLGAGLLAGQPATEVRADAPPAATPPAPNKSRAFGTVFNLPSGWVSEQKDGAYIVHPSEAGMTFTMTHHAGATDAAAAVKAAWDVSHPGFSDTLVSSTSRGAVIGWDDLVFFSYDPPASENRLSMAAAFRKGTDWIVVTAEAKSAVFDKNSADAQVFMNSIVPLDYTPEDFTGRTPHTFDAKRTAELRDFVQTAMKELRIPGAAFAVVEGDKIVDEEGLGVRTYGEPQKVDAHTRFMIASNTKGMTTLLLARLVDEGKMQWDEPVSTVYPKIALADPDLTRKLEIRHLICACTGLPRADYETYFVDPNAPAQLTFDQLKGLKPTTDFGATFQYSNTLAAAAGFIGGHVAYPKLEDGAAYDKAMKDLIWTPLGMNDTNLVDPRTVKGNYASPHADTLTGKIGFAPQGLNATLLPYRPAGSAWSSVHDMAIYVRDEVMEGKLPNGQTFVSKDALLARRTRGVPEGEDEWYGMGLSTKLMGKIETIHHGGAVNGYKSEWIVVPSAHMGAVILVNGENGTPLVSAFRRKVMELLYDGKPEADANIASHAKQIDAELESARQSIKPVGATANLAGYYTHSVLGSIRVVRTSSTVVFDFGPWSSTIGWKADPNAAGGFDYVSTTPSEIGDMSFVPGTDNGVRTLTLSDLQHNYVYKEAPFPKTHGKRRHKAWPLTRPSA